METLKSNFSRNQQQSVMMLEEWSTTQKEWKKTEKKLKTQVKTYQVCSKKKKKKNKQKSDSTECALKKLRDEKE